MKILVVTPHFAPESFKCNDMAAELARRGHDVTVMTAIPDYPEGRFHDGYGVFKRRRETTPDGVKIRRSLIIPRGGGGALRLALNYISYTFFASVKAFYYALFQSFDCVVVHETSPVMVGVPGVIVKKLCGCPMHFWVLDLWPESLEAAGGIHNKNILGVFRGLTRWIYRNSDSILISSRGFEKSINTMGGFGAKIDFFPNWIDKAMTAVSHDVKTPKLPDGFNVMFAGNIGDAHDMPHLMEAMEQLRDKPINLILVGDGRRKEWVERYVAEHKLYNVRLLGRFPLEAMPSLMAKADVMLLSLKDVSIFSLTVPAKLQAYMAAGKPVVAMINGEGAQLIAEADCGWSVAAEQPDELAKLLARLSVTDAAELARKGANGKRYALDHYDFDRCVDHLERVIGVRNQ